MMADIIVDELRDYEIARYYEGIYKKSALIEGAYEAEDFFPSLGNGGKWLFFTAAPLRDHRGKITGAIETLQSITERKHAEAKRKQTVEDMKRSNAELELFAYVASQDLQEPLRMVASYVQLLAQCYKGKLDADADDFISYAVDGATHMQTLINDLLAYSRVGTHGKPLEPTDCETVLEQVLTNLKMAIEESGAVITHDALPTVMVDGSQQVQLFQNLIENAIKFRGDEVPRIHISATRGSTFVDNNSRPENTHHDTWVFSVRDNGIGLEPEFFERIFTIFQRLHSRDEYAGTGIGLAVCKKIVERYGGRMGGVGTGKRYDIFLFNTRSWIGERNEEREIAQEMRVYPTNFLSQRTFAIFSVARGFI